MAEVFARGPVGCGVDAAPLLDYAGGIINDTTDQSTDHIVSITGWGVDAATNTKYWIVRNSWGEAWGENGAVVEHFSAFVNRVGLLRQQSIQPVWT